MPNNVQASRQDFMGMITAFTSLWELLELST